MPAVRVAFVEFYRQWPGYFCDSFNASFAGALRSEGHSVRIYKCFLHESPTANLGELERQLGLEGPWDLIVIDRVWSHELIDAMKRAVPDAQFVVMQWDVPPTWTDIKWRVSPSSRSSLVGFVNRFASDRELEPETVPNLYQRDPNGQWIQPAERRDLNVADLFAEPLDLAYDLGTVIGLSSEEFARTRYLVLNMGCPYRTARNDTGFLKGLPLATSWGDAGCTFCNVGRYESQTREERAALMQRQLKALIIHGDFERLVVQDEYIFRDLDILVDSVVRTCKPGVDLMVRARVAYLESCHDVLVRALDRFANFGTITPYLVGFENFSDAELMRYNKGQSGAEGLDAVRKLEELASEHPNLRISPSQGFILFGPWTSLDDLEVNLRALKEVSFNQYRGGLTRSKLRLNPDAAIVARAQNDGLLVDAYKTDHEDNAAGTGYQAEIPYRFLHPEVSRVWELLNGHDAIQGNNELDRLAKAIEAVKGEHS